MGLSHSHHHAPSKIGRSRCEYSRDGCDGVHCAVHFHISRVAVYIFISRGWGDFVVRTTQMAVIGLIFPNATALVKEF
jgi:hypothetical protein